MDLVGIVLAAFLLLSVLAASVYFLFFPPGTRDAAAEAQRPAAERQQQRGRGRRGRLRERRRRAARGDLSSEEDSDDPDVGEDGGDADDDDGIGERQRRINAYEEKRRERDAEREAQEEREAAERLRKAEERRKQEEEEAQKWAEFITVEDKGEVEDTNEDDLLARFVTTVQERKIVVLEDLAVEFGIRTQDVIHRMEALEGAGRLTGIMDDRGKYIYITPEEMQRVADYIESHGRVSIAELSSVSHRLVDLESKCG